VTRLFQILPKRPYNIVLKMSFNDFYLIFKSKKFTNINSILLFKNKSSKYANFEYAQTVSQMDRELFNRLNGEDSTRLEDAKFKLIYNLVHSISPETCEISLEKGSLFLITIELKSNVYKSVLSQFLNGILEIDLHLSTHSFTNNENKKCWIELFKQEFPLEINFFQTFYDSSRF
jgi:hypothetical protein